MYDSKKRKGRVMKDRVWYRVGTIVLSCLLILCACDTKEESSENENESRVVVQKEESQKIEEAGAEAESKVQKVESENSESIGIGDREENVVTEIEDEDWEEESEDSPEVAALKESIQNVKVGQTFFLGSCEQDNDPENGFEAIEWILLYKTEEEAFVISKKALEYMPFAAWYSKVTEFNSISQTLLEYEEFNSYFTWEEDFERNPPRIWLRDVVYEQGFSETEKAIVKTSFIQTAIRYNQIVTTREHLYVPGLEEVQLYLNTQDLLQAEMTDYVKAKAMGVEGDYVNWSVRSMGISEGYSMQVLASGEVYEPGVACATHNGVRPVMWLTID